MNETGRLLLAVGLLLALVGGLLLLADRLPLRELVARLPDWLTPGRLPGDIHVERGNSSFSFPIVTCLIVSVLLSLLLSLFRR